MWLAALIGIAFPTFGLWLVTAFVPPSLAHQQGAVRLSMLGAAVIIPFLVGIGLMLVQTTPDATRKARTEQILEGWPYTIGLAVTMMLMLVLAPYMKLRTMARGWVLHHVPVVVPEGQYFSALEDIEGILNSAGFATHRRPATWMLTVPTKVLAFFAKSHTSKFVADQLTVLVGEKFRILLHPSDIIVTGPKSHSCYLRALLTEQLAFTHAFLTWDSKAHKLERKLKQLWLSMRTGRLNRAEVMRELELLEGQLQDESLSYEEWEILFREKLQIEHGLLEQEFKNLKRAS